MSSISKRWMTLSVLAALVVVALTALFYIIVMDIERQEISTGTPDSVDAAVLSKPVAYVGVVSRYPPTIMFRGYQPIMDYLTATTPYRFELVLGKDYQEALHLLLTRKVSAVFLGSYQYVRAHTEHGIIPVLKPLNEYRQPLSRSVLFVRTASSVHTLSDLAGRTLALPSSESFSAHWPIDELFAQHRISTDDLANIHNFAHHHTVIAQVLNGSYEAGVTREYLVRDLLGKEIRALAFSDPIPSSPLVALKDHHAEIIQAMTRALLRVNENEQSRLTTTRGWDAEFVNGFVAASDADYEVIRRMSNMSRRRAAR